MVALKTFFTDAAESTLSAALAAGATTINVTDTTAFPAVPFYATIDPGSDSSREIVLVDAGKTATTFTLTAATSRGQGSTSDVTHESGAVIAVVPVSPWFTDLHDRIDGIPTDGYTPGGTDVAVTDGGTGASTAAGARANLSVPADADVVKLTGDQAVGGIKTFSASPVVPAPTTDLQASTKKYVDDTVGNAAYEAKVDRTGATAGDVPTLQGDGTLAFGSQTSVADDPIWDAAGDLVYGTGADAASRLGIGTAGQVLKVNAGATAPEWADAGSTHIEAKNTAGTADTESVTWTTAFAATPIVQVASLNASQNATHSPYVRSRSTTGATVEDNNLTNVKMVTATEAS